MSLVLLVVCVTAVSAQIGPGDMSAGQTDPKLVAKDESRSSEMPAQPDKVLRDRAERVWNARVSRDCKTVAKFLDPKEYVSETPEQRLQICEGDPFRYEKYRIDKVEADGNYGWIHIEYSVKVAPYQAEPAVEMSVVEKWRQTDGEWFPVASRIEETCPESPSKRDAAQERRLRERFDRSWTLRMNKDWKALYDMTDPKDRSRVSESDYGESEALIEYFDHEVDWVQAVGDTGEIRVTYTNKLADPNMTKMNPRKINISEKWINRDGEWYRELVRAN